MTNDVKTKNITAEKILNLGDVKKKEAGGSYKGK